MKKNIGMSVLIVACLTFISLASYKLLPDIFGEKKEVIHNNFKPAKEVLYDRGVTLPDNIEKGKCVYSTIVISNREQYKKHPADLLWVTSFGKEKQYFLFYSR